MGGFFTKENPTGLQELAVERTKERGESKKRAVFLKELWTEPEGLNLETCCVSVC